VIAKLCGKCLKIGSPATGTSREVANQSSRLFLPESLALYRFCDYPRGFSRSRTTSFACLSFLRPR
jgi:hypothetical protein